MSEHKPHFINLKLPLGGLLAFYGVVLMLYGLFSNPEIYQKSLGLNANLIWGTLLLVIGTTLLVATYFDYKRDKKNA